MWRKTNAKSAYGYFAGCTTGAHICEEISGQWQRCEVVYKQLYSLLLQLLLSLRHRRSKLRRKISELGPSPFRLLSVCLSASLHESELKLN